MLESQLATLAWNDMSRRSPMQAAMLKELAQLGITQDLANSLVRKIPRRPDVLGRAPLRARDRGAHHPGHRRSLAREGRRRRVRGSGRRRQDHAARQARRALGAAPWPAPCRAGLGRRGAHRRARTDAHAGTPAGRHHAQRLRRRRAARTALRAARLPVRDDRHRGREPARSGAGAPPATAEPDAGQHRDRAGAAGQHPGRRHRRSRAALRARASPRPA